MAYADIQNKVGQIQMANRILLAQRMDPNKTPETDLEGFQEQGGYAPEEIGTGVRDYDLREVNEDTPVEGTLTERKRISGGTYKGKNKKPKRELPSDADIQTEGNMRGQPSPEDIFGEDYEGGPTYLRQLLQIGGAVGGGIVPLLQQLLIRNPNAMASTPQDGRAPTRLFYNPPYDKPKIFIKDKQTIEDAKERFKWNTGIDLANTRGYQVTGNGFFADPAGRVFQNIDGKLIYEGNYDEAIHGELIPPTEQANQSMQINPLMANFPYEFEGGVVTPRYFTPPRYRNQPFLHIRTKDITDEELFHFNNFIRSMGGGFDTVRRQTPLSIG